MYASTTSYHRGTLVIDVRPGESHSAAWAAMTGAEPQLRHQRQLPDRRQRRVIAPSAARRVGASRRAA